MSHNILKEIIKCKEDFSYFCENYVKVFHPERGQVPFKLYDFQKDKVFPTFEEKRFVILKKFRQAGLSTIASIYSLWKILFFNDQKILIISKTDRESKHLMTMIRTAWEYFPDWLRCETPEYNQHVIKLETGSEIRCGTPKMGRSFSANHIIIDEAAFIKGMDEIWKSIFPTLSAAGNTGKAFVISTVNGLGNWYADIYHDAVDGKNDFYCLDLSYKEHPDYNNEKYVENMKAQLGERGYEQEVLGLFLSSGNTFIGPNAIQNLHHKIEGSLIQPSKSFDDKLWIWKKPRKNRAYILCSDIAEGLGGKLDYSTFHVLDVVTLEQVCEFCDNTVSTYDMSKIINEVGRYYNDAIVVIERNGLGVGVIERLFNDLEYDNIYLHREGTKSVKRGFQTTLKNRQLVLDTFRNLVEQKHVKINSPRILHEIQTFEFNPRTRKPEARSGRHDDLIMAMALGLFVRNTVINQMPIGLDNDYNFEEQDDYEPTFDIRHQSIIKSDIKNDGDYGIIERYDNSQKDISDMLFNSSIDPYDEEELLKEFGWL